MKRKLILEVDPAAFFDVVAEQELHIDSRPIGDRVVAALLGGASGERIGLQFYGVEATSEEVA